MAAQYQAADKLNKFPFQVRSHTNSDIIFQDSNVLNFQASTMTLDKIGFFAANSCVDTIPYELKQSWDLFRREPAMYAFNSNKPSYSSFDRKKKAHK